MTSLMVQPPLKGEDSYDQFQQEESDIMSSLLLVECLNTINLMYGCKSIGSLRRESQLFVLLLQGNP